MRFQAQHRGLKNRLKKTSMEAVKRDPKITSFGNIWPWMGSIGKERSIKPITDTLDKVYFSHCLHSTLQKDDFK